MEENLFDDICRQKLEDWIEPLDLEDALRLAQMLDDTAFDTILKQKLDNFETPLHPFDWKFLSQNLNQQQFDQEIHQSLSSLENNLTGAEWEDFAHNRADIEFDTILRGVLSNTAIANAPDWDNFAPQLDQVEIENHIQDSLAHYEVPFTSNDWKQLQTALRNTTFDISVQEKLADYQTPYLASDWLLLRKKLDGGRVKYERALLLLLLLLVFAGGFYWFGENLSSHPKLHTTISNKKVQNKENALNRDNKGQINAQTEPIPIDKREEQRPRNQHFAHNHKQANNAKILPYNKQNKVLFSQNEAKSFPKGRVQSTAISEKITFPIKVEKEVVGQPTNNLPLLENQKNNEIVDNQGIKFNETQFAGKILRGKKTIKPLAYLFYQLQKPVYSTLIQPSSKSKRSKFQPTFRLGTYAAIMGSTFEWNQSLQKGISVGARAELQFAKHWTLVADVMQSSRLVYQSYYKRVLGKYVRNLWTADIRSWDIPISIRKDWGLNRFLDIYIQAGIAPSWSFQENYNTYTPSQQLMQQADSISTKQLLGMPASTATHTGQFYWKNMQVGGGIRGTWKNWALAIEPRYFYWGTPVQKEEKNIHTLSIATSLSYSFGKK
jgi:hypothetical protein